MSSLLVPGGLKPDDAVAHLAAIVQSSEDAIISKTLTGIIVSWNAGAERVYGYGSTEAVGSQMTILLPEGRTNEEDEILTRIGRGEEVKHFESVRRRKNGELIDVSLTISPIRDTCGHIVGVSHIARNVTERKQLEEQFRHTQRLESLGVLASGIAHDFNNLLGSILAEAELGEAEVAGGSAPVEELRTIKGIAIRAGEIVRELMIYAGHDDAILDLLDLSQLVGELLALLKVSISKHAILKVDLPENLPMIRANASHLRQVVMNLITNASEALGKQEGFVSIAVTQVRAGSSESPLSLPCSDYLRLEISDTGCGMTEEIRSKIFDPFFTTKFAGRGMGLAAVRGIVRSHDGTINVLSAPGQGSRFEILLPCSRESAPGGHSKAVSVAAAVASFGGTVLIVEDEDELRLSISKMLRRKGLMVIEAADGKTGIDLFRVNAPEIDVVLLDLILPGMSGGEVLSELRGLQPEVKVIITSAYSEGQAFSSICALPTWGYIRKPYAFTELLDLLRSACMTDKHPKVA